MIVYTTGPSEGREHLSYCLGTLIRATLMNS